MRRSGGTTNQYSANIGSAPPSRCLSWPPRGNFPRRGKAAAGSLVTLGCGALASLEGPIRRARGRIAVIAIRRLLLVQIVSLGALEMAAGYEMLAEVAAKRSRPVSA